MLEVVDAADVAAFAAALRRTLDGGPAMLPLPADPAESARAVAALRPDEPELPGTLVVATSGSTGAPKGVRLPAAAIAASAAATQARLGGPGSWHLALPAHYVAGAMVVARALLAGSGPVPWPGDLAGLAVRPGRNYLSLVPTQARRALGDPALLARLAEFDAVLLGGAAAAPELLAGLREAGVAVITTYGMSETCGGCVYDGVPLDGVDVRLGEAGRIELAGPMIFAGYRLRPDLTDQVLAGDRFRTSDRGVFENGRLRVRGRVDEVIISGGVNVDLAEVQRAVEGIGVSGVVVGVPDPEWGTRVALATTSPLDLTELRERLSGILSAAALPRALARVAEVPLLASGKPDRQKLINEWDEIEEERR